VGPNSSWATPALKAKLITHAPEDRIEGHYIVKLRSDVSSSRVDDIISRSVPTSKVNFKYQSIFRGFSASLTEDELNQLALDQDVEFIEEDTEVKATDVQADPPSWGLDRIDQTEPALDKKYSYQHTGKGVNVYVIDTGIKETHEDFGGRVVSAFTSIEDGKGTTDCNGHGTHVAATIGGKLYGVAKEAKLNAVRVLSCAGSGTAAGVIAGIDWVQTNHVAPAVINMSLGGRASASIDTAVKSAVEAGVTVVVAAGNSAGNACSESPSRAPEAITVGATALDDTRASFSNHGKCVDLFAPGKDITSAWINTDQATKTISGTSMASPHVAGVAALYLEVEPAAKPDAVAKAILAASVSNKIKDVKESPNQFLQNGFEGSQSSPCMGEGCVQFTGSLQEKYYTYRPNSSYYYSTGGAQEAWLEGPTGADFDLELMRWNGSAWGVVAKGITPFSSEHILYNGTAGYYTLRVTAVTGSGEYQLWLKQE
jgi:subtilisin family serine protease